MAARATSAVQSQIDSLLSFLDVSPTEPIELRALGVRDSYGPSIRACVRPAGDLGPALRSLPDAEGIYFVASRLDPQATLRLGPSWQRAGKGDAAKDGEITHRRVVMIDCDPVRPSGTSGTDEQHAASLARAADVRAYLVASGVSEASIATVDSGNGCQIWLALDDIPESADVDALVRRLLVALAARHDDDIVRIDTGVHNAARVYPVPGTVKRKGREAPDLGIRHRPVTIDAPGLVYRLSLDELRALVDRIAPVEMAPPKADKPGPAKATPYTTANATPIRDVMGRLGLMRGEQPVCPGCGEADGSSVAIVANGLKCMHDRCSQRGLMGFRTPTDVASEALEIEPRQAAAWITGEIIEQPTPAKAFVTVPSRDVRILTADDFWTEDEGAAFLVRELGIAPGAPTMIVGQGYVGKTVTSMSLGISIATGRPIWGTEWEPTRTGRVLHLDYEQGARITKRRVRRLCFGLGVSQEELAGKYEAICFPPFDLTSKDALDQLCRWFDGRALVILDSLKKLTPGVEENSSAIRDYMGLLTIASEKTGCVPQLVHHAGKTPLKGERDRKEQGRGSSSIFDEAQTWFTATGKKGEPFLISHEKDREAGETVSDFALRIVDVPGDDNPKAGLAVVPAAISSVGGANKKANERARVDAAILQYIRTNPKGPFGVSAIRAAAKCGEGTAREAIHDLLATGQIANAGDARRPNYIILMGGPLF